MSHVVDLTQPLGPDTALWPGSPPFAARTTGEIERDGHYARAISLPEHSGTHFDAPGHFAPGGALAHEVAAERLVVPCAVVDVTAECDADPGYALDAARLERDEAEHGPLPEGGALLVRTGWDRHAGDPGVPVHHLTLPAGLWHIEGLVNLDALPPRGATLFVGALKLVDGSGTPARVLALVG